MESNTKKLVSQVGPKCYHAVASIHAALKRAHNTRALELDPVPQININDKVLLSPITKDDKLALLEYLNETDAFQETKDVAFPFTEGDADELISGALHETLDQDGRRTWAIRETAHMRLVGIIGLKDMKKSQRAEIWYWIARPYWGRGVMTEVIRCFCAFVFKEYGLRRIYARVYGSNRGSCRVLEKSGFEKEDILRQHCFRRDGSIDDSVAYGILSPYHLISKL